MARARTWTCPGCGAKWHGRKQLCDSCGRARPKRRVPKHQMVLETPYEWWVEQFGERCGICARPPGPSRRLDRDHDHSNGKPRGLLCHRCNRALAAWVTADWLRKALLYVERSEEPDLLTSTGPCGPLPGSDGDDG
jgi:hypothetical protein